MNVWCRRHGEARAKEAKAARCPKTGPPLARAPAPTVRAPKRDWNDGLVELPGLRATIEEEACLELRESNKKTYKVPRLVFEMIR